MFYSMIQTLVCVLLIQGSLYALHLSGNSGGGSGNNGGSLAVGGGGVDRAGSTGGLASNPYIGHRPVNLPSGHSLHMNGMLGMLAGGGSSSSSGGGGGGGSGGINGHQHASHLIGAGGHKKPLDSSARLTEELADMAQLERERLMLLGLAKQTAAANAAATGHHGRPIITGRIQMTPGEEIDSGDYTNYMMQPNNRGYLFGSVVKHPKQNDDYDSADEFDGGGGGSGIAGRHRPTKYEYGRVVSPSDREYDPHNLNMDEFMELDADTDDEDMLPDMEGYQYLDELLAERNRGAWEEARPHHNAASASHAFQTLEELELNAPQALQELFEKEQRDEAVKQPQLRLVGGGGGGDGSSGNLRSQNIRLQQKWQKKRSQQQQQKYQRNIFGQRQQHHYNPQHMKLSMANSEATATKHIDKTEFLNPSVLSSKSFQQPSMTESDTAAKAAAAAAASNADVDHEQQQSTSASAAGAAIPSNGINQLGIDQSMSLSSEGTAKNSPSSVASKEQNQLLHQTNRKRSGGSMSSTSNGGYPPPVSHSIASQLMLRTARGQRQYDVPQIECPTAMDGMERFACPTPDLQGRYRCIDDHVLCDGFIDCPEGEDEDRRSCMFYKTTKAHLDVLADALLRWARGR